MWGSVCVFVCMCGEKETALISHRLRLSLYLFKLGPMDSEDPPGGESRTNHSGQRTITISSWPSRHNQGQLAVDNSPQDKPTFIHHCFFNIFISGSNVKDTLSC